MLVHIKMLVQSCFVLFLFFNASAYAKGKAKLPEAEDPKAVDLITFIDEVIANVGATKDIIEKLAQLVPEDEDDDLRDVSAVIAAATKKMYKEYDQKQEEAMEESAPGNGSGSWTAVRKCVNSIQPYVKEDRKFTDGSDELKEMCTLGNRISSFIPEVSQEIAEIQQEAQNLSTELVRANLWCSTNHDEAECYEDVHEQAVKKALRLQSQHEIYEKMTLKIWKQSQEILKKCEQETTLLLKRKLAVIEFVLDMCIMVT